MARTFLRLASLLALAALTLPSPAAAAPKKEFKVCWSIYVGWMPWGHMSDTGIMKKWADKYGLTIDVVKINDYVESINQYTAGAFDGCAMTNMDALSIPAGGGVDTTALIVGDFSNGNDAVILKGKDKLAAIKGQKVNLVELSVSHYLLARALDSVKLKEKDIKVVNTSDADIVAAYKSRDVTAAVTWNPLVSTILEEKSAKKVFDSAQIPGEIIDLMVVNTGVLKDNPDFGKALVGAWYETIALMKGKDTPSVEAKTAMAKASATDLEGFESQLGTTQMFYEAAEAVSFTRSPKLVQTMDTVRNFLFSHGILGQKAKSVDVIGIAFPDGTVLGAKSNVKLRFDPATMELAADGKL